MAKHLAIFQQPYLELILSGVKTIDGRFSKKKTPPFGLVRAGDVVVMKESGGLIYGEFTVEAAKDFSAVTQEMLKKIRNEYGFGLSLSPAFWKAREQPKFITLMFIQRPLRYPHPFTFRKKDRRSWMVLEQDLLHPS